MTLTPRERARRVLDLLRTTEGVDALEDAIVRELEPLEASRRADDRAGQAADVAAALRAGGSELTARVLEVVPGGVVVVGKGGAVLQANAEAARILGLSFDALTNLYVRDFDAATFNEDGTPCPAEDYPVSRCLATGRPQPAKVIGVQQPGADVAWAVFRATPLDDPRTGALAGAVVTFIDITHRRRAEEALRRSEERFRTLVHSSPSYIWVADREHRIVFINRGGPGYALDEIQGKTVYELGTPESHEPMRRALTAAFEHGEASRFEGTDTRGSSYETQLVPLTDPHDRVTQVMAISTDVSQRRADEEERRRMDASIREAQRLASLSLFAGGVAHDFNNMLTGIRGNVDLVLERLPADAPDRALLEDARRAALRASELTEQLLAYSGRRTGMIEAVDLNALTEEMAQLLRATTSRAASLHLDLDPTLPAVEVDPTQVRQVVMNLIRNASDALEGARGTISVRSRVATAEEVAAFATALRPPSPGPERYVVLEVEDHGAGMSARTCERIFDPFFTTKPGGHGLGLAAALGIVRAHGGAIGVESSPGEGATFRIALPIRPGGAAARGEPTAAVEVAPPARARPLVLVVDDERHVRAVARLALEEGGFEVLTAEGGREAVELFRRRGDEVRAIVLDLLMPDLDGGEVLAQVRALRPDVPVILSSGYGEDVALQGFTGQALAGFLKKPYHLDDLLRLVRGAAG